MEINMKENLKTMREMEKAFINIKMEIYMMVII